MACACFRTGKGVDDASYRVKDRELLLYSQLNVDDVIRGFVVKHMKGHVLVK